MIRLADTFTGTPCSVSSIINPLPTSFTARASSVYFSGLIHWSHRRTGGIESRWTKKPAKVIWNSAASAESGRDGSVGEQRRKKEVLRACIYVSERNFAAATAHIEGLPRLYKARISRNLKKLAASGANLAIQYVLRYRCQFLRYCNVEIETE